MKSGRGEERGQISTFDIGLATRWAVEPLNRYIVRPVTASKSQACLEGHVSNDEAPAFAKATAWQANDEGRRNDEARMQTFLLLLMLGIGRLKSKVGIRHCLEMAGCFPRRTYFWTLPVAVFGSSGTK